MRATHAVKWPSGPTERNSFAGEYTTNDSAAARGTGNLERGANRRRALAHTDDPVRVEPSGLALGESGAVVGYLEGGPKAWISRIRALK